MQSWGVCWLTNLSAGLLLEGNSHCPREGGLPVRTEDWLGQNLGLGKMHSVIVSFKVSVMKNQSVVPLTYQGPIENC